MKKVKNQRRFNVSHVPKVKKRANSDLTIDHPSAINGKSRFSKVHKIDDYPHKLLKGGHNSKKIGRIITKGPWQGFPIFTLTLEERATCPRSCENWLSCYGNNMHWSHRLEHGEALEVILAFELAELQEKHPKGFAVRLHVLGDFYSEEYVLKWLQWMDDFPALHVFGFTARKRFTKIGKWLRLSQERIWKQFAIRTSGYMGNKGAFVVKTAEEVPKGAILCPVQTGKTDCCANCGLCWNSDKPIAFLQH